MCACVNGHRAASGKTNARTGNYGLGYYLDKYPVFGSKPEPKPPAPAAKPKAIGLNNSIVKGLAPKGGGIGKKKKSGREASEVHLACVGLLVPMLGCCCWQLLRQRQRMPCQLKAGLTCEVLLCTHKADDAEKPAYLREMEAWQKQACSSSSRTGSLVK